MKTPDSTKARILFWTWQKTTHERSPRVCLLRVAPHKIPTVVGHHVFVPPALIPMLHRRDVLVKTFPLLVTHSTQILGKPVEVGVEVVHFDAHSTP